MRTILIVGIGTGNPEHLTIQAIKALNRADVLFIPDKGAGKADLGDLRRQICAEYVTNPASRQVGYTVPKRDASNPDYEAGVDDWHAALADIFAELIAGEVPENGVCAFLVWGDPGLYDSTIRILDRLRQGDVAVEVIPGITSVQALTAAHGIGLNRIGEPVKITTGRRLGETVTEDSVVMLDGQTAFNDLSADDIDIFWGAYLGTPDEILISGALSEVKDKITTMRMTARAEHGWIMDTYLLRKRER